MRKADVFLMQFLRAEQEPPYVCVVEEHRERKESTLYLFVNVNAFNGQGGGQVQVQQKQRNKWPV